MGACAAVRGDAPTRAYDARHTPPAARAPGPPRRRSPAERAPEEVRTSLSTSTSGARDGGEPELPSADPTPPETYGHVPPQRLSP